MITWGEFKKGAKEAGIKDEDEIWYIDFSCEDKAEDIFFDPPDNSHPSLVKRWRIWS